MEAEPVPFWDANIVVVDGSAEPVPVCDANMDVVAGSAAMEVFVAVNVSMTV